jgi:predicted metal-binding membrane protein
MAQVKKQMNNNYPIREPFWIGLAFVFLGWLYTTFQVVFASVGTGFNALGPGMQFFDMFKEKILFGPESIIFYLPICTTLEAGWSVKTWLESFLMWAFMIFAMMLPSLLPSLSSKIISIKKFCGFLLGYLAVWMLFCIGGIFIQWVLHTNGLLSNEMVITNAWFASLLLALVGIYQFSKIKMRSCIVRNQLLASSVKTSSGIGFNLQAGTNLGISCAISCGPLMLTMFAFGLMNVIAMLVLTIMMFVETNLFYGEVSNKFIGLVALVFAAFSLKIFA